MAQKYTIKQILLTDHNWWNFYEKHKDNLRPAIVTSIAKVLSCKTIFRGKQISTLSLILQFKFTSKLNCIFITC